MLKLKSSFNILSDRDFLLTFSGRAAATFFSLFTGIISARLLGPAGRGEYYFTVAFATIVSQISNFGLPISNLYYGASNREKLASLISNSFWVSLVSGVVFAAISIIIWSYTNTISSTEFNNLLITLVYVPLIIFYLVGGNLLIAINKISTYNFYQLISTFIVAFFIVLAAVLKANSTGLLIAITIGWLLVCVALLYSLRNFENKPTFKFDFSLFRNSFKYSLKAYFSSILGILTLRINTIFLIILSTHNQVGYYSIAAQINDALVILPTILGMLLFPKLVVNEADRWAKTQANLKATAISMFLICVFFWLFGAPIIKIAFGESYNQSVILLMYMLPGIFFYGISTIVSQYLMAEGFPMPLFGCWILTLLLISVLNVMLIPQLESLGAAISFSCGYSFLFVIMYVTAFVRSKKQQKYLASSEI